MMIAVIFRWHYQKNKYYHFWVCILIKKDIKMADLEDKLLGNQGRKGQEKKQKRF